MSRNIAIRRLGRRFRRAEKVHIHMEESNRLPKIDATNIGSLPTTRRDGASCDRPGFPKVAAGVQSLPPSPKKGQEEN